MIDLQYSRERMLADIGATDIGTTVETAAVSGLSEPAAFAAFVGRESARLMTRVHEPHEVLVTLEAALAARFAAVPRERLQRDFLAPLKKALGNAHKRGNRLDPGKWIRLEVAVTRTGAFVQVSDEGAGFDVAATCARFAEGSRYFSHHGSGFRKFHKARAVISFDDGGRTFRARFTGAATPAIEAQRTEEVRG